MYRRAAIGWMKHFDFMLIDIICLEISYMLAYYARNGISNLWDKSTYRSIFLLFLLIDIIIKGYLQTFNNVLKRGYYKECIVTFKHVCLVMLMTTFFLFITQTGKEHSRIVLVMTGILYAVISYAGRVIRKKFLLARGVLTKGKCSLLIITTRGDLEPAIKEIKTNSYGRFQVDGVAVVDCDMKGRVIDGIPVVANKTSAVEYARKKWIDEVFIELPLNTELCNEITEKFTTMGITVHLSLQKAGGFSEGKHLIERIGSYTVLTSSINMTTIEESLMKRFLDICGGIVGCFLTGIFFIFVAPCIYMKSPGSIFFSQIRIGKNGKKFKLYKFRSMYPDAEERKKELMEQNSIIGGMMFKMDYDPRIIGSEKGEGRGIGNFIRKYSIDEFPQFWNVLKGDMSLVGTRPPTVDEWERYSPHHRKRLAIKPGITGIWQVSGRSGIKDFEEVVKLDTQYITGWSLKEDLRILAKTVLVVLRHEGAM